MPRSTDLPSNLAAFLDMIAASEIGAAMLALPETDDGYKVIVGSTPAKLDLVKDYTDHPRKLVHLTPALASTAAGRYQILARYFDSYRRLLNLPDFGPESQDRIAIRMIGERSAMHDVGLGNFRQAVDKVHNIWASLPGAGYGQHENKIATLEAAYVAAGGTLSA